MTRLDSAIRRLQAQRACLDYACRLIADRPGPVIELGLGNGRTYDHLRARLPGRDIYAFDRQIAAHPDCIPDEAHMFLGDFTTTLPEAARSLGPTAVLAHCDVGSGDADANAALADMLSRLLPGLLGPGAVMICDQDIRISGATDMSLPDGVSPGRYFLRTAPH
ncbi:MAG: class I SAM-dependent methyltransferase [Alphaproteobacteria bacterium]|nr:class I SAM-dependent methyltransferase [Alphaproteobacteria bacterium]